jgi:hypothetical protein
MENSMEAPQKTKNRTASSSTPREFLKECKSGYNKDTCTLMFITLFITTKLWKQPR